MSNNGDDYEDDFDAVEGEALDDEQTGEEPGDEEWDSYDENQDEENLGDEDHDLGEDAPPKKKSGLFNIVLIVVAMIAVGGFIFMQMGKNVQPAAAPAPVAENTVTTPPAEPAGMLGSPQELAKLQEAMAKHNSAQQQPASVTPPAQPVTPAPETVASTSPPPAQVTPAPVTPVVPSPTPVSDVKAPPMPTAMETPVSNPAPAAPATPEKPAIAVLDAPPVVVKADNNTTHMPKAQDIMLKSPSAAPVAPEVTPAPAPTPSGSADAAALNVRIDTLLTRIASLEAEVTALKSKEDPASQIDSLKSSVDSLEKKIDSLPSGAEPKKPSKKEKAVSAPVAVESAPDAKEETKPAPQILGADNNSSQSAPPVAAPAKKSAVAKPIKVSKSWTLKGAQPGQAIVARAGESDTQTIGVGDSLPGIGKITAIEYQDRRWTVIGTQGRINQ